MGVSKDLVNLLNIKYRYNRERISDFLTEIKEERLGMISMKNEITQMKNKLIKFSDHDENEEVIDLLMNLEINQDQYEEKVDLLKSKINSLENIIENIVDNYDVDLRDFKILAPRSWVLKNGESKISDDIWKKVSKARDRGIRLKRILEKNKVDTSDKD